MVPSEKNVQGLLKAALSKRRPLYAHTNAVRLVNGAGDGLEGIVVEQFDHHFSVQVFSSRWHPHMGTVLDCLKASFDPRYIVVKDRSASRAAVPDAVTSTVLLGKSQDSRTEAEEYGAKFLVDLDEGLNTGLFLDMRAHRRAMGEHAAGRRVLNCFAYTCSFGVHTRLGGAVEVVNVDVSKKILERGRENYVLNGLVPGQNEFIAAETGAYLERAVKKDNRFDMIIIDPPSFAHAGKKVFQVKKDLPRLVVNAVKVLNPGGILFVSSNFTGLGFKDIQGLVQSSCAGRTVSKPARIGQGEDFPGTNTFKESYLVGMWAVIR